MFVFQEFLNLPKKASKAENTETINLNLKLKNIEILPLLCTLNTVHCVYNVHSIPSGLLISSL